MDLDERHQRIAAIFVAVIVITALFFSIIWYFSSSAPAYEFKTGANYPIVSNWTKYGTVVLFMYDSSPRCENMKLRMEGLQSQVQGVSSDVFCQTGPLPSTPFTTFHYANVEESSTDRDIAKNYSVLSLPTILVIRGDGAVATFVPQKDEIDTSTIKNAIDEAVQWAYSHPRPTPTPVPPTDYSSYFEKVFIGGNAIVVQPFTKGTNDRGNDVYKGITRNSSLPASSAMTTVIELTKSQAEAKQLFDQMVAQKLKEGFTARPDWVAATKARTPSITEDWEGQQSVSGQAFVVMYSNDPNVSPSWLFQTEAGGAGG